MIVSTSTTELLETVNGLAEFNGFSEIIIVAVGIVFALLVGRFVMSLLSNK